MNAIRIFCSTDKVFSMVRAVVRAKASKLRATYCIAMDLNVIFSVRLPFAARATMTALTLYDKLWDSHVVRTESDGTTLLYVDRHLVHEVTSPQAFEGLKLAGRKPWRSGSIIATADHNTPTLHWEQR